jgi:hypothetical protein
MRYFKLLDPDGNLKRIDECSENSCNGIEISKTEYDDILKEITQEEYDEIVGDIK